MAVGKLAVVAGIAVVAIPPAPAKAQIYPGWDFGGGIGIGIGPPPSAYTPCPNYGWPVYPYPCAYRYYGHAYHSHNYRRSHRYARATKPPAAPATTQAPAATPTQ